MNPYSQLIKSTFAPVQKVVVQHNSSRTESIRSVLRKTGRPMSAAEIFFDAAEQLPYSANSSLIGMLLKWDIKQGRVRYEDGRYSWNGETEAVKAAKIRAALRLLRTNGFVCTQEAA